MMTVAEMIDILKTFPPDLEVVTIVDEVPKDDLEFNNFAYEPGVLYIQR